MSDTSSAEIQSSRKHNSVAEGLKNVALVGTVAVAAIVGMNKLSQSNEPKVEGDAKTYVAKPGDTEWGIAQRAFPSLDPREVIGYINAQENQADQKSHNVVPGTPFYFASDAKIGSELAEKP